MCGRHPRPDNRTPFGLVAQGGSTCATDIPFATALFKSAGFTIRRSKRRRRSGLSELESFFIQLVSLMLLLLMLINLLAAEVSKLLTTLLL
jgi:hypothetical protein